MKYYIDSENEMLYAYSADGSQDEWIKPHLTPISIAEYEKIKQEQLADKESATPCTLR